MRRCTRPYSMGELYRKNTGCQPFLTKIILPALLRQCRTTSEIHLFRPALWRIAGCFQGSHRLVVVIQRHINAVFPRPIPHLRLAGLAPCQQFHPPTPGMHQLKGVMKTPFFLPPLAIAGQQDRNAWWLGHKVRHHPQLQLNVRNLLLLAAIPPIKQFLHFHPMLPQ